MIHGGRYTGVIFPSAETTRGFRNPGRYRDTSVCRSSSPRSARIIAALVAVFTVAGLTNPVGILSLGLLFDFAAVLTLAFREGVKLTSRKREGDGISVVKALFCSAAGIVTGVICSLVPLSGLIVPNGTAGTASAR